MASKTIKGLNFQPWVGANYGKGKYGKLLLLGESHYINNSAGEDEVSTSFTQEVVEHHLEAGAEKDSPYFRTLDKLFKANSADLWNSIAFSNLIQVGLDNSRSQPTAEERSSVIPSLQILLDNLKPEKLLFLSKRLWQDWIYDVASEQVTAIGKDPYRSEVWKYPYKGGSALAIGMTHPSRIWSAAAQEGWSKVIDKFLKM